MKILVFSDSHGRGQSMLDAVSANSPDLVLHLGDGASDCGELNALFPSLTVRRVRGNCDIGVYEADSDEFVAGGFRFFMTHGHKYGAKYGPDRLLAEGFTRGADVVLYGHTHVRDYMEFEGIRLINPGSIGYDRNYGLITIENGQFKYESKRI